MSRQRSRVLCQWDGPLSRGEWPLQFAGFLPPKELAALERTPAEIGISIAHAGDIDVSIQGKRVPFFETPIEPLA